MSAESNASSFAAFQQAKTTRDTLPPLGGGGVSRGCGLADAAREEKAEWIRQNLPECSAVASAFRAEFGSGVRMSWARENGYAIGKQMPAPAFAVSGDALNLPIARKVKP